MADSYACVKFLVEKRKFEKLAKWAANAVFLRGAARLWEQNQKDYDLPISRFQKLKTGIYILLRDYSEGRFPPRYDDKERTYAAEINYIQNLPGISEGDALLSQMRKPFRSAMEVRKYLGDFVHVVRAFEKFGVKPPQRLLELGCGHGWMSEWLAIMGFDITATTLAPSGMHAALRRVESIKVKSIPCKLEFKVAAMESVNLSLSEESSFDAVFVYEALHHAFDVRATIGSATQCLRPGGFLFLFNEPNLIHTCVAYRRARLSNTHEVGLCPGALIRNLKGVGFRDVTYLKNRFHCFIMPISLAAKK